MGQRIAPSAVIYFDLVVDEPRQLLYGSDVDGGTIHVISMNTQEVLSTLRVGARPAGIDISPVSERRKSDARFDNFGLTGYCEAGLMIAPTSMQVEGDLKASRLNHVIEPLPDGLR